MINDEQKTKLANRLQRIAGQVAAVQRMIEEDVYCIDILTQISAACGALGKVGHIVVENHIQTCVSEAAQNQSDKARQKTLDELVEIFRRYSRLGN